MIGHIIKAAWVILALACVSYVGIGFGAAKKAEATTLDDIAEVRNLFYQSHVKVVYMTATTFKIGIWQAQSGSIANCFKLAPSQSLAVLNQQGHAFEQINVIVLPSGLTEKQCYDTAKQ